MTTHCFTYGTLMCADIMSAVSGRKLVGEPASLGGYSRHAVRGEDYPGIRIHPNTRVQGMLYRNLDITALERLDAFEGEQYSRESVTVTLVDGSTIGADTYVIRPEYVSLLLPEDWDFDDFLAGGKARFQARYLGFSRLS